MNCMNYHENYLYYYTNLSDGSSDSFQTHNASAEVQSALTIPQQDVPVFDIEAAARGEQTIGLKLTKTPSLLSVMDQFKTSHGKKQQRGSTTLRIDDDLSATEKLKAANFPAVSLQIGSWKTKFKNEGDLIAKFYFKKRKIVWEVWVVGSLKTKIEFPWSDVTAIRVTSQPNEPSILDIQLAKCPLFFREVNPQPRKHTNWEQCNDFTDNQASLYRNHRLEFATGVLEKHYERIIQADERLYHLSQQPFPDRDSPLFQEIHFTNEIDFGCSPQTLCPQFSFNHTTEVMDFSVVNSSRGFYQRETYPIHDHLPNQGVHDVHDGRLGGISSYSIDHPSEYAMPHHGFVNQHGNYVYSDMHDLQQSYVPTLPYVVPGVEYHQPSANCQDHYYYNAEVDQWEYNDKA